MFERLRKVKLLSLYFSAVHATLSSVTFMLASCSRVEARLADETSAHSRMEREPILLPQSLPLLAMEAVISPASMGAYTVPVTPGSVEVAVVGERVTVSVASAMLPAVGVAEWPVLPSTIAVTVKEANTLLVSA